MDESTQKELRELADLASKVMEEGRAPTEEERKRFVELKEKLANPPPSWGSYLKDEIDRIAAALEGMGI